jgi:hypothetical protein
MDSLTRRAVLARPGQTGDRRHAGVHEVLPAKSVTLFVCR